MIVRLLFGILLAAILSCSGKETTPDSVLPKEKMEALLWDLLRAEHFVRNYVVIKDSGLVARSKGPVLYEAILKKHGTTDSLFKLSLAYYKDHPKLLFPILDSIGSLPDVAPTPLAGTGDAVVVDTFKKPADSIVAPVTPPVADPLPSKKPNFAPKPMAY